MPLRVAQSEAMKNLIKHILTNTILGLALIHAQQFDIMNVNKTDKVAMSSHYTLTKNGIEQFTLNALSQPFVVTTGDTLYVGRQVNTTSVIKDEMMPTRPSLHQNFPNPFNNSTVIRYAINQQSDVSIKVYDMTGKEISTLVNESKQAGTFSVGFSNTNIASGTYFYRLIAKDANGQAVVETKKMIVMK
jgi:hypothetical protein